MVFFSLTLLGYEQDFTRETNLFLNADKPQTLFLILLKILTTFDNNIMVVTGNRSAVSTTQIIEVA